MIAVIYSFCCRPDLRIESYLQVSYFASYVASYVTRRYCLFGRYLNELY